MINFIYVDLFCGAGGTSTGVESAKVGGEQCAKVIACIDHDANAIASHAANHPGSLHFTEDIRTLELTPIIAHINKMKSIYSDALIVLWASLECTNFSKAKGGQPRDADSRTLAEHLFRYIDAINPDYIQIENVQEFMSWGELDSNGKPISMDKGKSYEKWVNNVKSYGYNFDFKILNSADYGAYTSRKRFFGIFAKSYLPIVFPEQTHSKKAEQTIFKSYKKWKPVKDVLDFSDKGESIFGRKKDLSEKTLERIYAGLIKFVAVGKDKWLLKYNSINGKTGKHIPPSIEEPCPTVSCQGRLGIVSAVGVHSLSKQFSRLNHHAFISAYYGNGHNHNVNSPCPTITCKDRFSLILSQFLDMQYCLSIEDISEEEITANREWYHLMNPQFASAGGSIDKPCFTHIVRMDKMPPYLVATKAGLVYIKVYDTDSLITAKIKEFMALYGIVDIKMRMLKIPELKRIMGFPEDYILVGTQAEQKKYIGNAVETNMARVLCEALAKEIIKNKVA